ncbi:MAG: L-serine ammonia-lyase, iron-sulfur-dependent, subunit alpha [Candidatus Cloacimonetes bacterium]|nr:L-serine ammonia-lyase, iron-sulfur-dependent, subunit alpha [Candidatus Cloacimonadota bacterium]
MESIRELYKSGHGPSSSHTMGPQKAASLFKSRNPNAIKYRVTLYGSLAATGKGHLTDYAILSTLAPTQTDIVWKPVTFLPSHPNGMDFEALDNEDKQLSKWRVYSVGGGTIREDADLFNPPLSVYTLNSMRSILSWCENEDRTFYQYVEMCEGAEIWDYLKEIWAIMQFSISNGLEHEGILPGSLKLARKATEYFTKATNLKLVSSELGLLYAYALAVSEENASGNIVVTAPTCGSCGVLPGTMKFMQDRYYISDTRIIEAIATAGLIGNLVKKNASISGAEVGCQGEIGVACAMTSGAVAQLLGGTVAQIEYAAEMGLEHHLGLTCDPIEGYVQIPCIERNAIGAARSIECATYALLSNGKHRIPFDSVVKTMNITGCDLPSSYRETSTGGLAKEWSAILGL